ncbi:MAG: xylulose kinase [Spirochaetales bacterium]|nr:MAG: xylulose kinase [Spirochaetales bacterium]
MEDQYVMCVDIGTTGAKATIFDGVGRVMASGYHEYICDFPRPGWVEQDADFIIGKSMEAARDALAKSGLNPQAVKAVSFSAQRCCTVFLDASGRLIRPMISWQDNRTAAEVEIIKKAVSPGDFYAVTAMPLGTTWMISKIIWVRNNEPENWKKVKKIIQLHDYALIKWGAGEFLEDVSDTGFYGLWDPYKFEWNTKLLDICGLDSSWLPKPVATGTSAGSLSAKAAELTGLTAGTPLCVGAGDQNSAALGAGVVDKGCMSISLGTGGLAAVFLDEPFLDPAGMTMITNHAIYGKWQLEGLQAGAASVFRWFRDEIAVLEKEAAKASGRDAYELLNEMAAKVPAGSRGLVMLPYFASATTPRWNSSARGTITGLTFAHDRNCLARAFMEGITLEVKDMVKTLLGAGIQVDNIRILGGPTKSPLWNQMQADMYNRPVSTLVMTDAAVLGAGIAAGVGIGMYKSVKDAALSMVKADKVYEPVPANVSVYDDLYGIYCKMYEGFQDKGVFDAVAELQKKIGAV